MQNAANNKIYCAVDIEATGFDPLTEEILEIGFVFFTLGKTGFEIVEEWSQVFRPAKAVTSKILALTGITEDEIASAPKLSEHHEFVQRKLTDAVLVGHSVGVDVRYLEANGFKLSGKYLDTLELVQFVLPTRHSYNLENLMHYFQIPHEDAHRALADAKASMRLLEKLLQRFNSFPAEVKETVKTITQDFGFVWHPFLSAPFASASEPKPAPAVPGTQANLPLKPGAIMCFPLNSDYRSQVLNSAQSGKFVYATPYKDQLLELWKNKLGTAVFSPEDNFHPKKFAELLAQKHTNPDLAKFLAKVAVWHGTNWQRTTVLDLNLSFAGNQFRTMVTGYQTPVQNGKNVLLCDHKTALAMNDPAFASRTIVVEGLSEFESQIAARIGRRASWGGIVRMLNSIYNPESEFGETRLANEVSELLTATDLFFGLSVMNLEKSFAAEQVTSEQLARNAKAYRQIQLAAENFSEKIKKFAQREGFPALEDSAEALMSFFDGEPDRVKWIDHGQRFCVFNNLPLKIEQSTDKVLKKFADAIFVDSLGKELARYYQKRLGIDAFELTVIPQQNQIQTKVSFTDKIQLQQVLHGLTSKLPLALVMPSYKDIKDFYDENFRRLKSSAAVFAEGYSGGVNKMFYNFRSTSAGLIILTAKLAVRSGRQGIPARTLLVAGMPGEISGGVYSAAVRDYMETLGVKATRLQNIEGLHKVIRLFFTKNLENVEITGPANQEEVEFIQNYLTELGFSQFIHNPSTR